MKHRTTATAPAAETTRTRRSVWRPVAFAAIGGSVLVAMGVGVYATLLATAANVTPESVTDGTLRLTMAAQGAGFDQAVTNVAPGDTINRYVDLTNSGTLDGQAMTLQVAATGASTLITDGASTRALRVSVTSCNGGTWNPTTGVCSGTTAALLAATPLSSLTSNASLIAGSISAGSVQRLRVSLNLPDQNETTVNGALPANTVQGQSVNLTYTFGQTQRTATTSNA
ncbi:MULTISPECIES: TasA family protein [Actinosynnema]|uniref:Camelysin metallo-endopeptidase n=1 Tax=Actinosynnema pretiosum TaxID=42197 RepID=A0A290Z458_9PSEU|nr:TasA family protein [Actinosynnema pretiosum]ATE53797.1 hypothetical protein CNX65_11230 [Actinosynnema pretiosum]